MDCSAQKPGIFAYSTNYLIEADHSVIVDVEGTRSIRQTEVGTQCCIGLKKAMTNEGSAGLCCHPVDQSEQPLLSRILDDIAKKVFLTKIVRLTFLTTSLRIASGLATPNPSWEARHIIM